jgi:glycosyltransferase involved in cell wall biosynthesis
MKICSGLQAANKERNAADKKLFGFIKDLAMSVECIESQKMKIIWLYKGIIRDHPFINLGISSLKKLNHQVVRCDESFLILPQVQRLQGSRIHIIFRIWRKLNTLMHDWFGQVSWFVYAILIRPDVLICTMPQALLTGWLIKKLSSCRLVYYPFELYGEQAHRVPVIWERIEKKLLAGGDIDEIITQNEARARVYREDRGSVVEPVIVQNFKKYMDVRPTNKLRDALNLSENIRIVVYEGGFVPGRWLDRLIQSVEFLQSNTRLVLIGKKTPWWDKNIAPVLEDILVQQRVICMSWLPPEKLPEYIADADVGVIIYDDSVRNNYYCAPGKLSDYVIAGVPVIAPNFPTIGPFIRQHGIGETFDGGSPEQIAGAILKLLDKPRSAWVQALDAAKQELIWETQENVFVDTVIGNL